MTVVRLSELKQGTAGRIASLGKTHTAIQEKLIAMGVLPGKDIKLLKKFPSYVFKIGHSQFAVDQEIASAISVILA